MEQQNKLNNETQRKQHTKAITEKKVENGKQNKRKQQTGRNQKQHIKNNETTTHNQ